jgi:hypothetical protein
MSVSSIGYYRVFSLNLRYSRIFILDPTTTGIVDKEDRMKWFSRALKRIEENIARIVRLRHSNYVVVWLISYFLDMKQYSFITF